MKLPTHDKRGFTLIELLTVIAIVAILSAILVPTVGQFRTLAKKTSDVNDLRRIVQASQLFAAQNGERFVTPDQTVSGAGIAETGGTDIVDVAAVLALGGELTDPGVWVSENESKTLPGGGLYISTAADPTQNTPASFSVNDNYKPGHFSFDYVTGLSTWMPSSTPVAFSRMATLGTSTWEPSDVYQASGGHVAFLNGSVTWYEDLTGKLMLPDGNSADTIQSVVDAISGAEVRQSAATVPVATTP